MPLTSPATDRLILLDAFRRAQRTGAQTEWFADALGDDPFIQFQANSQPWPSCQVLLVGSQLASALRPYARDLAGQLLPPGSNDHELEAAAEQLLSEDSRLLIERLEQEQRYGVEFTEDGYLHLSAQHLDRKAMAACIRPFWIPRKAPEHMLGFAGIDDLNCRPISCEWILIHDPGAPKRLPSTLKCPHTQSILALAGHDTPRLIDRTRRSDYQLWAWLEPNIESGTKVLIGPDRDHLLTTWAKTWF